MRDIKFRVYSTVTGGFSFVSMVDLITSDNSRISKKMVEDDLTVEQFTSLTDKNGTEVYEGDIIQFCDNDGYKIHDPCRIVFFYGSFCIDWTDNSKQRLSSTKCDFKVIGNIHQNPELLEE